MGEAEDLIQQAAVQGEKVRALKTAKAPDEDVKKEVAALLAIKSKYKEVTGEDFPNPNKGSSKKKKKKDQPAEAPKKTASTESASSSGGISKKQAKKEAKKLQDKKIKEAAKKQQQQELAPAAGQVVTVPAAGSSGVSLAIVIPDGETDWANLAVSAACILTGTATTPLAGDLKTSVVTAKVGDTLLSGAYAVVGYIMESAAKSKILTPEVQQFLEWHVSICDTTSPSIKDIESTISPAISRSKAFLTGENCSSADIIIAAWCKSFKDLKYGKAVQAWINSVIPANIPVVSKEQQQQKKPEATEQKQHGQAKQAREKITSVSKISKPVKNKGPRTPLPGKGDPFYITTAINYTNGDPHIGHAYEAITADVIARFHRVYGRKVYFMTGTDEHGKKIAQTAEKKGLEPIQICDEYAGKFQNLNEKLSVSHDFFIRTTMDKHKKSAQKLWEICHAKGDLYLGNYEGWYNIKEEEFVTDNDAQDMDFKDAAGNPLERMKEESYFFKMSKYADALLTHIKSNPDFIQPDAKRQFLIERLEGDALRDLSVSRATFSWGVQVPNDPKHVMYVWFDALSNYISGVDLLTDGELKSFWPANVHIIGKDIMWFHCVIWPCMLLSAGIPLPKTVFGHGFVQDKDGKKMSKSVGNVVDPFYLLEHYPIDGIRYFVITQAPYGSDLKCSEYDLRAKINSELNDILGNLAHRTTNLTKKFCDGVVPDVPLDAEPFDFDEVALSMDKDMAHFRLESAAVTAMNCVRNLNEYFTVREPWKLKGAEHKETRMSIVKTALEGLYYCAHFLQPFIPNSSASIFEKLGSPQKTFCDLSPNFDNLKVGTKVTVGEILFQKLEEPESSA